ncbi:MAG: ABC transporter ATP-binding protein/permease [Oscillospiraceae bacterium]|nr:ABC transporter ATP-binding protein/permease [Oscillospiraceae bacterium]
MARNKFDVDEELESPFDIRHFKRALKYVARYKKQVIISMILSIFAAVIGLFAPLITQRALDVTIPAGDKKELILLAVLLLLSIIISVEFSAVRARIMTKAGQDMVYDIRKDLFKHLQQLPFEYYDTRPHGKILTRVINYVNSVSDLLTNGLITFVLELFNILFIIIFMFIVCWQLALVVLAGMPLFILFMFAIKKAQRRAWQGVSNKSSNLNAYLHEGLVGVSITQSFDREEENEEIFDRLSVEYRKAWMKAIYFSNAVWPVADNISIWVSGAIYLVGLLALGPAAGITVGTIVAMTGYSGRFWQPIMNLSNLYNTFVNTIAYLERIFETMDEPVTVADKENATEMPKIKGDVSFKNVTFGYENSVNVLENLSFDVKAGQSVALVGPTGAGKTTIVNLISRFYNLNGGQVLIDGQDISDVTLKSLRSQMGIMLQDSVIFSGTIRDNIRYGRLDATDEEIRAACKIVGADEFINEMPKGYDTIVKERGSSLSQGQKQMIAFARTILADPKILVLDEATSSIDAKTERYIQQGIDHLLKGRTSFIIAHRLSTIRSCDKIMYISDKGIAESGTHDELMAKKGLYYKLCMAQSL